MIIEKYYFPINRINSLYYQFPCILQYSTSEPTNYKSKDD